MQLVNKKIIAFVGVLAMTASCSHVEKDDESFYSLICDKPEEISDGMYELSFDLISTSHGSMIYFEPCPKERFIVRLSRVWPNGDQYSDFAGAIYRNSEDPFSVLKIRGKLDYKFTRSDDFTGGKFTILSMDNWEKAKINPAALP